MCPNTIDLELCPINYFSNYGISLTRLPNVLVKGSIKKT